MAQQCPDCGNYAPEEDHAEWCVAYPYQQRAAAAEAQRDELAEQLATAKARIAELESYIDKHNQRVLSAFERTAPLDWRSEFNDETPPGQMLDGQGDEVE